MSVPLAIVIAAALLLALAPAANAARGVVGSFQAPDQLSGIQAIDVNTTGAGGVPVGTVYVAGTTRIERYNPGYNWISRWGWDVTGVNEVQTVPISAGGGNYKLTFEGDTTAPIPYNAENTLVRERLEALDSIGPGDVTTTFFYSPGSSCCGTYPITGVVSFGGSLAGTDLPPMTADGSELTDPTGTAPVSISVETRTNGGGGSVAAYEVCTVPTLCKTGQPPPTPAPLGSFSTSFGGIRGLAVDQTDGSIWVYDRGFNRIHKFSAIGEPLMVAGKDVNQTVAGTGTETCVAGTGDICKTGAAGALGGEFGNSGENGIAIVPPSAPNAGNILIADSVNRRVQEFDSAGGFKRAFGWDVVGPASPDNLPNNEEQSVKIVGAGGTFKLTYSNQTTAPIAFDAPTATVEAALEALSNIDDVEVTGGPGDETGSNPYVVTFLGNLADLDVAQMTVDDTQILTPIGFSLTCSGPTGGFGFGVADPPPTVSYQWLRNGAPIGGATTAQYVTTGEDAGKVLQCRTTATAQGPTAGGAVQASVPYHVVGSALPAVGPSPPTSGIPDVLWTIDFNTEQTRQVGSQGGLPLTCPTGTWGGSPSFTYQWYRNGVPLSGNGANTSEYIRTSGDMATPGMFQCAVTGTNAGGSVTLVSRSSTSTFGDDEGSTNPAPTPLPASTASVPRLASISTTAAGASFEVCDTATECRAGVAGAQPGQFETTDPDDVVVAPDGLIYVAETSLNARVQTFTADADPPGLKPAVFGQPGAPTGNTFQTSPRAIAMGPDENLLVSKRFDSPVPPTCFNGAPIPAQEVRIQEISSDGSTLLDTHGACANLSTESAARWIEYNPLTGDILLSTSNAVRLMNEVGVPELDVEAPQPTPTSVTLTGLIDPNTDPYPNPTETLFQIEYKLNSSSEWIKYLSPSRIGASGANVPFSTTVFPLLPNTQYDIRVVAFKDFNGARVIGDAQTFTTLQDRPEIESLRSTNVRASSADLNAIINPRGTDTTYYFEYGTTPDYGTKVPITPAPIGDGQEGVPVTEHIEGIESAIYHFRVVAENAAGITRSVNQTFTFYPPVCPNTVVRQQTGSAYLPDCRAYEIASPANAGGTVLYTWAGPVSGRATSPSRISFMAVFGGIPDAGDPPGTGEIYVASRTNEGWVTKYVGLPSADAFQTGYLPTDVARSGFARSYHKVPTSLAMDRFVMWDWGYREFEGQPNPYTSFAPYVFDESGAVIDRWPTNFDQYPANQNFVSTEADVSEDFSHFVFNSDKAFAPGGLPGDIYDNDVEAGTVEIVSRDPENNPFEGSIVGISTDGSRILMSNETYPECKQTADFFGGKCKEPVPASQFYMRMGGTTHDVTDGHLAKFGGMSGDGSKVYFLSSEQVTADDEDTSVDLFVWHAADQAIERVSAGPGDTGNTDLCTPVNNWTPKCDVRPVSYLEQSKINNIPSVKPEFFHGYSKIGKSSEFGNGVSDAFVASESGDIFFFSPEQLTGDEGVAGRSNLYLYRGGELDFVASFAVDQVCHETEPGSSFSVEVCADAQIGRIQVTPDGRYAAFTAMSRLTGFDNAGKEVMYRYDAEADELICVSCPEDGSAPQFHVRGSMNGLFLTDDGRTFFGTKDAVVPPDTNEGLDVYEFVEGRPQLISNGLSPEDEGTVFGTSPFIREGLLGVSANGTDAFFATRATLAPQDENGGNMKVYTARVNGGFPVGLVAPPCAAADECHGPSSSPPAPLVDGSGADRGPNGGNAVGPKPRRAKGSCASRKKARNSKVRGRKGRACQKKRSGAKRKRANAERRAGR